MNGPIKFVEWTSKNVANDKKFGRTVFRYHPRSDHHSKILGNLVADDLLATSPLILKRAEAGEFVGGTNQSYTFANGKTKTLDLAIGEPVAIAESLIPRTLVNGELKRVLLACELKQCMTEHSKTKPRLYDELSSSHEIVHQGDPDAIAAGIVVVNIADSYASPTRQVSSEGPLIVTAHKQPAVTESMVAHLKGLKMRDRPGEVGFDAFAIIVVNCDNVGPCTLHTGSPSPQPGDPFHYDTFIKRIVDAFEHRFA